MYDCQPGLSQELLTSLNDPAPSGPDGPPTVMIGRCAGCCRRLPWPAPKPGCWASPVACPQCGRWYYTEARNSTTAQLKLGRGADAQSLFELRPPEEIAALQKAIDDGLSQPERRRSERFDSRVRLPAVPLGESFSPVCETVESRLLNLASAGCCVQMHEKISVPFLLLDFGDAGLPGVQVLAAVRWRQEEPTGQRLGCEFLFGEGGELPIE